MGENRDLGDNACPAVAGLWTSVSVMLHRVFRVRKMTGLPVRCSVAVIYPRSLILVSTSCSYTQKAIIVTVTTFLIFTHKKTMIERFAYYIHTHAHTSSSVRHVHGDSIKLKQSISENGVVFFFKNIITMVKCSFFYSKTFFFKLCKNIFQYALCKINVRL